MNFRCAAVRKVGRNQENGGKIYQVRLFVVPDVLDSKAAVATLAGYYRGLLREPRVFAYF
jgi:hypothetical protein